MSECPICGFAGTFVAAGYFKRRAAACPQCRSLERHRLVYRYLMDHTPLPQTPGSVLHFAPEPSLEQAIRAIPGVEYRTSSLHGGDVPCDMQCIPLPDASVDVVLAVHVLEHVPDDRKALAELRRIIRPGGWAVLLVPLVAAVTFEDEKIVSAEDRERVYGHPDHWRSYGPDFGDRMLAAGFAVTAIRTSALYTDREIEKWRMARDTIFHGYVR